MKKLLIAVAAPLLVLAAGSAWAATDSDGSVTSTSSSTTSTATSTSTSTSGTRSAQPSATVWQHLSPVTIATVNPQHSTSDTLRPLEKQHRRHPIGMQRHPGAVQASEHETGTDPRTGKTIAQSSAAQTVSAQ